MSVMKTVVETDLDKGPFRAARGTEISCKGWQQEAALRMLMNNLDPEVAEKPEDLVVYGGTGKAARNWECFHAIVRSLKALANDETLLVQSGKPVGIFRTHEYAPRVLLCNSNLVGHWNNWETVPRAGSRGSDDVRADDRGQLDLHRDTGNFAGDVRDVCGGGRETFWRRSCRQAGRDRRHGRHGRSAAAGGDDEWRGVSGNRRRSGAHQEAR